MELEKQVCGLELAKKIKELGVKQESIWFWAKQPAQSGDWSIHYSDNTRGEHNKFSAFTVAELGKHIGKATYADVEKAYIEVMALRPEDIGVLGAFQIALVMIEQPDIPAQMLIYLLEKKLITV